MEYFFLKQERNYRYLPRVVNWYNTIDVRKINRKELTQLPQSPIFDIVPNKDVVFYDIILSPFFMVSHELLKLIDLAEPFVKSVDCLLVDTKNYNQKQYFIVALPEIDCLAEESILTLDKSRIKKAVIDAEKARGHSIFKLGGIKDTYIVVSLPMAEMILGETSSVHFEFEEIKTINQLYGDDLY